MKRIIVDLSSVCWTSLFAGTDKEFGVKVEHNGRQVLVNSAQHGYENAINMIDAAMRHTGVTPANIILVEEGVDSKSFRKRIFEGYKAKSNDKPEACYVQFNLLKPMIKQALLDVGACVCSQPYVEADDIIAYLVGKLSGEITIVSNDGDLFALYRDNLQMWKGGTLLDSNPFGPFDPRHIQLYKALVGDDSDTYPGAKGFGDKAFLNLALAFGDEGLDAFCDLLRQEEAFFLEKQRVSGQWLRTLEEDVCEFKPLQKVLDNIDTVVRCWMLARLYPEKIDTMRQPLQWQAGMVKKGHFDERLRPYSQQIRLVTAENYEAAVNFLQRKLEETAEFCLDLETTVPQESDDWLALRESRGVDVVASTITGCGLTFGNNNQYGYYISVDHADTDNVTIGQLADLLALLPRDRITVAHNAAGFELPVMYNAFGQRWKDNGWRGFFPNMVDSRIAASYWDENQPSHGLKNLSKLLLGYDQETYAEVTGGKKMDELTAKHVLSYGLDDVFCTTAIWNFFRLQMEIEGTLEAFMRIEQKPMYLSALSFVQGTPISLERLFKLKAEDEAKYTECSKTLNAYLIEKGWSGTQCPVLSELTPAGVKEAVRVILGTELETQVRTVSKLAKLVDLIEHEDAPLLARLIEQNDLAQINDWMARRFDGTPEINVGSNKQLVSLMYETMGLPIRLRNKPTDAMRAAARAKGEKVLGNPRADDEAMAMAIKMGDASEEVKPVLEALTTMKSINTKMGLYWNAYPNMVHWKTRKLHPEFRQSATNTRRYTCGSPNLQQLDAAYGGVRSVVLPHHRDAVIVSLDESGQEVRLLSEMSGDVNLRSCFVGENLKDTHSITAAMILDVPYEEFITRKNSDDKDVATEANTARQNGKTTFFAVNYGSMAPKVAETLGISEEVAQGYIDSLERAFPGVFEWKKETESFALSKGYVEILGGTRRHLANLLRSDDKWAAQKALRQASNARIQSAGGNQLKLIMSAIWDSDVIEKYDYRWYFSVHDETVHSIGRGDAVECIKLLHGFMTERFMETVPSKSSIGLGSTFGTLIEIGEDFSEELVLKALDEIFHPQREAIVV